jgi:sirohydrochlorin cobaltochelatase
MPDLIERTLAAALSDGASIGQIFIQPARGGGFVLCHADDRSGTALEIFSNCENAIEIARYDDDGNYRPLKTAPNLRHGWQLEVVDMSELRRALDYFYPGRLAILVSWKQDRLTTTPLRETLNRQSGMYRVAAKISDEQIDHVVGNLCRSGNGCLRTIVWKRDASGAVPSTRLPPEKFDPAHDQTGYGRDAIPLLCQEACSLLVNECRKAVKGETSE